jgi:hypothetical protein
MRYELTDVEWSAIVGPRVLDAVRRLLAVRRRAGTNQAMDPPHGPRISGAPREFRAVLSKIEHL